MRLLVLVLNLERRHDRREWMERTLCVESGDKLGFVQACDGSVPALARHHHGFVFTPCANWALSASELGDLEKRWTEELGYTAPDAGDLAEFYGRDLTAGEVACFATHHAAWVSAAPRLGVTAPGAASAHMTRWQAASVGEEWVAVVLEDDVTVLPCEEPRLHVLGHVIQDARHVIIFRCLNRRTALPLPAPTPCLGFSHAHIVVIEVESL